jgi:uncharacterized protein YegJ (DUF2314 family)
MAKHYWLHLLTVLAVLSVEVGCSRKRAVDSDREAVARKKDKTISVAGDDEEMNAAIAKARSTLPIYWKTFDNPAKGERGFSLKVRVTDESGIEHFWVGSLERKNGKVFGTIDNEPNTVKSVKFGQRIEVPEADITDWMFLRGDKIVGNYTVRPLLKSMPKEKADKVRAALEEP